MAKKSNGKYLWYALLGLGFHPESAASRFIGAANLKHINLGPNMFEKPNKDAFQIVTSFLLEKLNPTLFHKSYRYCCPVLNHKADAEFRKVTCAWLREIIEENGMIGPKVVASLFLSPGGNRFIDLMLYLANHVMLQEMKTFTTDGSWFPEAAATPASSLDMAVKRLNLTKTRFLRCAVEQDSLLQEYSRLAQTVSTSIRDLRAEDAKYDELLKCYQGDVAKEGPCKEEKIQKARSLWSSVDGMLSTLSEHRRVVECVMKGDVDQYTLDGTDQTLRIPQVLLDRIEGLSQHLKAGNLFEAGQLNLLCLFEVMGHALQLLKEERLRVDAHALQLNLQEPHPQHLRERSLQMAQALEDLRLVRDKISKEEVPEVRTAIKKQEAEWDRKWMEILKDKPLTSFLNEEAALGFLSPMAPLSFEPATEATCRSGVFSLYPAKLPDETPTETARQEELHSIHPGVESDCTSSLKSVDTPVAAAAKLLPRGNTSLFDLFDTPSPPVWMPPATHTDTQMPPCHQASSNLKASVKKKIALTSPKAVKTKAQILERECDNLASQFADAIMTVSPMDGRIKDVGLDELLSTLGGDPFSTRKQLPRTPESLIKDVKSSWRKAIEESTAQKARHSATFEESTAQKARHSATFEESTAQKARHSATFEESTAQKARHSATFEESTAQKARHSATFEESTAQKARHLATLEDSMAGLLSSVSYTPESQQSTSCDLIALTPAQPRGSFNTKAVNNPGDSACCLMRFNLDDETLPIFSEGDSLLSDKALEVEEEEALLLPDIPLLIPGFKLAASPPSRESFTDNMQTPDCLVPHREVSCLDRDWLISASEETQGSDKAFLLDLPDNQVYSLPQLISSSTVDSLLDMP